MIRYSIRGLFTNIITCNCYSKYKTCRFLYARKSPIPSSRIQNEFPNNPLYEEIILTKRKFVKDIGEIIKFVVFYSSFIKLEKRLPPHT